MILLTNVSYMYYNSKCPYKIFILKGHILHIFKGYLNVIWSIDALTKLYIFLWKTGLIEFIIYNYFQKFIKSLIWGKQEDTLKIFFHI